VLFEGALVGTPLSVEGVDVESLLALGVECLCLDVEEDEEDEDEEDEDDETVEEDTEDVADCDELEGEEPGAFEDPDGGSGTWIDPGPGPSGVPPWGAWARATCASKSTKYSFKTSARRPCPCPISART